ncbi:MAG TPA: D-2-hydroxyacid dehydrogenase [Phycisphaerales bacterium]|nr:D-2-hydroxyacid dehydrogenase [Phycisphaerales bacterium]
MKVAVLHDRPDDFREWLKEAAPDCQFFWADSPESVESMIGNAQPEAVFSIKHSQFPGPAHLPALHCPSVRWFHVGGSGTEHLGNWDRSRVTVTNSAGVLAPFHAERAVASLLFLTQGLKRLSLAQQHSRWSPLRFPSLLGKRLLIIGLGHTGRELASRLRGFGMKITAARRSPEPDPAVDEVVSLKDLPYHLPQADVVSLNVPLNASTRHLINSETLSHFKPGSLLLNGSRGDVVDQQALWQSLRSGRLGGAWLDVTTPEPLPSDSPLWKHSRVLITPHCADQVEDFPLWLAKFFVRNLERYRGGKELLNQV